MAEKISATEGALERGAQAVEEARTTIDSRIKDVDAKLSEMSSYWQGDAAASYTTLVTRWDEKANNLNRVLNDLRDNLRGTASDQQATEEEHQSATARLSALLG